MSTPEPTIYEHPFAPYAPQNAHTLILGSFPGIGGGTEDANGEKWFYSAAGNLFWPLLSKVYNTPLHTVKERQALCSAQGIAITDIFKKIKRKKPSAADAYLIEVEGNEVAIKAILDTGIIKRILFTSKFVEKHFNKKFPNNTCDTAVLLSPSGLANRYVASMPEYKEYLKTVPEGNTNSYRIKQYSELLEK